MHEIDEANVLEVSRILAQLHGARGGAPKGEANGNYQPGEHTAEVREAKRLVRAILRRAKDVKEIV